MKKRGLIISFVFMIVCVTLFSCSHSKIEKTSYSLFQLRNSHRTCTYIETEYSYDDRVLIREDWGEKMTKLTYTNQDEQDVATLLFYNPFGWWGDVAWHGDLIWEEKKIIFILACRGNTPKVIINDSSLFRIVDISKRDSIFHSYDSLTTWRHITQTELSIIEIVNRGYETNVQKTIIQEKQVGYSEMPDWLSFQGEYYKTDCEYCWLYSLFFPCGPKHPYISDENNM